MTTPPKQIAEGRDRVSGVLPRRAQGDSGAALLIVLVFIVFLAVILVAFLSNSQRALQQTESSSTILKTQLLGDVATAAIVDDLTDEMKAGADEDPAEGRAMQVSQPWAMVPSRVLKETGMSADSKYANLVKQSVSGQPFFSGTTPYRREGKNRASGANTSAESRNQRKISAERWNKPKLLGDGSGAGEFRDTQLPDWIYITRAGVVDSGGALSEASDKTPTNSKYVLGRFAYNIYRVDGLLDINVAGFDPIDSDAVKEAALKGSLAWADLRAIPGLDEDDSVNAIVEWRNKLSKANYPAMIAGLNPGAPAAPLGRWGEPGGFLEAYTDGTATDNRFFSRQDLLKYFDKEFGEDAAEGSALPFLTTFSADLNQPSFRPDPGRPRVAPGAVANSAQGDDDETNPSLLSVLGSDGKPIVKRRFPLDRLKYLDRQKYPGESAKVGAYFGLTWNDSDKSWDYVDGTSIKRLDEIEGREPNLIELLQAGISTGSLGGQFDDGEEPAGSPRAAGARDFLIEYQVMRIAACIIDQYDTDSYPTRIRWGTNGHAFGVENLPYLYGMRVIPYRQDALNLINDLTDQPPPPDPGQATGPLYRSVVMIQPILWNPHAPSGGSATAGLPTRFRVTANSGLDVRPVARRYWWSPTSSTGFSSAWPSKTGNPRDSGEARAFSADEDYITFSANVSDFREPYALNSPGVNAATAYNEGVEFYETILPTEQAHGSNRVIGFRAGWSWSGPWYEGANTTSGNQKYLQEGYVDTNGIDFELEYESPDGRWLPYDRYEKFVNTFAYRLDRLNSGLAQPWHIQFYLRGDPRVDRYGARAPLLRPRAGDGLPQGESIRPGTNSGLTAQRGWPADSSIYNFTVSSIAGDRYWGLVSENKPGNVMRYRDPDGMQRLAMGGYSSGLDGLPMATGNNDSRPMVLNRPFRSVAELGHVLRDQPWKQLDFFSKESGDAALLDMFCLYESENPAADPVVSGRVNLNTARTEVLKAMLQGVELRTASTLSNEDAQELADALVDWTASSDSEKGPLKNRSELVSKFISGTDYRGFFKEALDSALSGADSAIPMRRQNALRGLIDMGTTRSWTFLIDLIVQDGQFSRPGGAPDDFVVRGEKRFWVHVAMDRFTGEVIAERVEEVHE